jgi:hypothetical protein
MLISPGRASIRLHPHNIRWMMICWENSHGRKIPDAEKIGDELKIRSEREIIWEYTSKQDLRYTPFWEHLIPRKIKFLILNFAERIKELTIIDRFLNR